MLYRLVLCLLLVTGGVVLASMSSAIPTSSIALAASLEGQYYSPDVIASVGQKLAGATDLLTVAMELASNKNNETRVIAAQLLAKSDNAVAAPALWKLLRDPSEPVGIMALCSLARLHSVVSIPMDITGLSDPRASVRQLTVEALGILGQPAAETALLCAVEDTDALVRMRAINSLARCGSTASVPALIAVLRDTNRNIRKSAANVLGKIGDVRAVNPLVDLLDDKDVNVRVHAVGALSMLAKNTQSDSAAIRAAIRASLHDDYMLLAAARELGVADNDQFTNALVRALLSEDNQRSGHASGFIRYFNITTVLPELLRNSHHPDNDIRRRIFELIDCLGNETCLSVLTTALTDKNPYVVLLAMKTLTRLHKLISPELFADKLGDVNPHIRAAAARFYGESGDRRYAAKIAGLLFDDNRYVRSAAAATLGKFGDHSAVTPLIELLTQQAPNGEPSKTPDGINTAVVIGIGNDTLLDFIKKEMVRHKQEAVRILGDMRATEAVNVIIASGLHSSCPELRSTSAYALGQIGDRRAVAPLVEILHEYYTVILPQISSEGMVESDNSKISNDVRRDFGRAIRFRTTAIWALGKLADLSTKPVLSQAMCDTNADVRAAAAEALAALHEPNSILAAN